MIYPAVSAIIPVYSRQAEVKRAIRSALNQTLPPSEIIVVDDGSQPAIEIGDVTSPLPIRLIRLPSNRGAAYARQVGIDAARGQYLAFLDSDDVWLPGKLKAQLVLFGAGDDPMLAVACGWHDRGPSGRIERTRLPRESGELAHFFSGCWYSPGSTAVLPRAAFDRVGPFDGSLRRLEDFEWFLRWGRKGGRLRVAPVIGAVVQRGPRLVLDEVRRASRHIFQMHGCLDTLAHPRLRQRLAAYLALEQAAAAMKAARYPTLLYRLFLSLLARPRATLHVEDWWPTSPNIAESNGTEVRSLTPLLGAETRWGTLLAASEQNAPARLTLRQAKAEHAAY